MIWAENVVRPLLFFKPEAYYHPTFDYLARSERNEYARSVVQAVAGVMARPEMPNADGNAAERSEGRVDHNVGRQTPGKD